MGARVLTGVVIGVIAFVLVAVTWGAVLGAFGDGLHNVPTTVTFGLAGSSRWETRHEIRPVGGDLNGVNATMPASRPVASNVCSGRRAGLSRGDYGHSSPNEAAAEDAFITSRCGIGVGTKP